VPPYRLPVKVVPGASRDAIAGWLGDALKVRVTAAPERGRANAAACALIARALSLPRANVRIVAGDATARKLVEIEGLAEADVRERLAQVED
jgi:uncharacterized protein YggU (UPF0235/DUF167 family)